MAVDLIFTCVMNIAGHKPFNTHTIKTVGFQINLESILGVETIFVCMICIY